ncbi:peptidoglycan-binding protein [Streptomyces sp. NPDC046759]|uniref:peptidoglycan-binding protein n=1 Tax=Streptomyces sp. NPDC046759 TaxID=3155019 RepID=UPI0033C50FF8
MLTNTPATPRPVRRSRRAVVGLLTAVVAAGALAAVPGQSSAATSPTVKPAATSSEIKLAQRDLNGLAYDAGGVDGVGGPKTKAATQSFQSDRCLGVDGVIGPQTLAGLTSVVKQVQAKAGAPANGDYGTATTSAVKSYQAAHHLSADGIAGEQTMKDMGIERLVKSCHATTALRARIVKTAKSQIGVTADSRRCVPGKPYSVCDEWCAAFATWVWRQSGVDIPFMTYVPNVYDWAVAHHKWVGTSGLGTAKPGDLIIYGSAHNRYHIGVVDQVSGGTVRVVSGNTSNPARPGQYGVYDKSYPLSGSVFYGLVRP